MFEVIGVLALSVFLGLIAYIGLFLTVGFYSDYPEPLIRLFGVTLMIASILAWYFLVGVHISIGFQ